MLRPMALRTSGDHSFSSSATWWRTFSMRTVIVGDEPLVGRIEVLQLGERLPACRKIAQLIQQAEAWPYATART